MQAILECKQCGAQLEVSENQKIVTCKYCGSANAVSFADRFGLYNRANYLRRHNEFDRAISVYEDILKEDEHDAEAYYGIALCKYGIEYVDDPNGKGKIPTCHRTKYTPISQDVDFRKAIENADSETAAIYQEEAGKIDAILTKIRALSDKQEKYDIFICYKEGDGMGGRTQTSVYAQEVYQELTKHGYKVFFARKTLESKLGSDYEPIIFAALFSARVMLVVGTKPEEFQGVWVRNEWTRYRERMANGEACTLIPLYRDMSPYELPQEFANLQALDMGKIGFLQDLLDGLEKLIRRQPAYATVNVINEVSGDNLKKRARLSLEQGDFSNASSYVERALDQNPEDAEAYIMRVQITRKCVREEELGEGYTSLQPDNNYQLALRFAQGEALERYRQYESTIQARCMQKEQEERELQRRREQEAEEQRIRKAQEAEERRIRREEERARNRERNKIIRKLMFKTVRRLVLAAILIPIVIVVLIKGAYFGCMQSGNYFTAYNIRVMVSDFLRETEISYIVNPFCNLDVFSNYDRGYASYYLDENFFLGAESKFEKSIYNRLMENNMTAEEWSQLGIETEYMGKGFSFGISKDGAFFYRFHDDLLDPNVYIYEAYKSLETLKNTTDKKGPVKQIEYIEHSWDYIYCVLSNGELVGANLEPIWSELDSYYLKKISDSRFEIKGWKDIDKIRVIGQCVLGKKKDGSVVYHYFEPDYDPKFTNLDSIDFDNITFSELMEKYR